MGLARITHSMNFALENLYLVLKYKAPRDLSAVGCFDYGPDEKELAGISVGRRNITDYALLRMEFYGDGWETWGTKEEVGYFLPRLLEFSSVETHDRLENSALFSLFKYKLPDLFLPINQDWTRLEKAAIRRYFVALLERELLTNDDVSMICECALTLGMRPDEIFQYWNSPEPLRQKQIENLLFHFVDSTDGKQVVGGLYLEHDARVRAFLDALDGRL